MCPVPSSPSGNGSIFKNHSTLLTSGVLPLIQPRQQTFPSRRAFPDTLLQSLPPPRHREVTLQSMKWQQSFCAENLENIFSGGRRPISPSPSSVIPQICLPLSFQECHVNRIIYYATFFFFFLIKIFLLGARSMACGILVSRQELNLAQTVKSTEC